MATAKAQRAVGSEGCRQHTALVLQGGGALGSYQAGVYQQLAEAGIAPDWVAGISIGALNAAIIAGNPLSGRVAALRRFWETIAEPVTLTPLPSAAGVPLAGLAEMARPWFETLGAWHALAEGQRGFYQPRNWLLDNPLQPGAPTAASFYDTRPMLQTLQEMVDFRLLNDGDVRVSIGAVDVETSELVYFDNRRQKLDARHFLASGALPPGFPPVEIDGRYYWDGGLVSNTPLAHVLASDRDCDTLAFQVDLWDADGHPPTNLLDVLERDKEIRYASRTRRITERESRERHLRHLLRELLDRIPDDRRDDLWCRHAEQLADRSRTSVIQLVYRDCARFGHFKDYQFGRRAMQAHWQTGVADAARALAHPEWLRMPSGEQTFASHELPPTPSVPKGAGD